MNTQAPIQVKLLDRLAGRYSTDSVSLYRTLKDTVFRGATDAELQALCVVAYTYDLNPFTKEIYAFPAKGGGIIPVVGIDGYIKTMNAHPQFDGIDFSYSEQLAQLTPGPRKPCPEWIEVRIYRKDRSRPIVVREYLDECFRATPPWLDHPRRMLRHKAVAQGARLAFGFGGVVDEDDAAAMVTVDKPEATASAPEPESLASLNARLTAAAVNQNGIDIKKEESYPLEVEGTVAATEVNDVVE